MFGLICQSNCRSNLNIFLSIFLRIMSIIDVNKCCTCAMKLNTRNHSSATRIEFLSLVCNIHRFDTEFWNALLAVHHRDYKTNLLSLDTTILPSFLFFLYIFLYLSYKVFSECTILWMVCHYRYHYCVYIGNLMWLFAFTHRYFAAFFLSCCLKTETRNDVRDCANFFVIKCWKPEMFDKYNKNLILQVNILVIMAYSPFCMCLFYTFAITFLCVSVWMCTLPNASIFEITHAYMKSEHYCITHRKWLFEIRSRCKLMCVCWIFYRIWKND